MCARTDSRSSSNRPLLCYVTDRKTLAEDDAAFGVLLNKIDEIISAGVDWVQIREKDLSSKELSHLLREALRSAAKHSSHTAAPRIFINDHLDLALTEGAGGVHLGGNSLWVADAKNLVRSIAPIQAGRATSPPALLNDFLLGVSCHSRQEAEAAAASGADYIFFGPVFATPSKAAFGAPQGLDRLAQVCNAVPIPVIAIGGITLENAASCVAAGAAGLAAISLFQHANDTAATIRTLRQCVTAFRHHQPLADPQTREASGRLRKR